MANKEQGGRVQPVSTPKQDPTVRTPAKLGASFTPTVNNHKRGKGQGPGSK